MQENKINWAENKEVDPEDINLDDLPKQYPQFNETPNKPTLTPPKEEQTRYVEFDEKAFMGQTGFIEDNEPYDVIELPSKGYFYPNKKSSLRVGYLTAADENILTSPNLIQSGRVIDVLLRKKIKDRDIEVAKLLPGDRTAVMLFLRATGYGKDYPVILNDPEDGKEFEYVVDLTTLPVKEFTEMPDSAGEFIFILPRTKKTIKLRLLKPEDETEIERVEVERRKTYGENFVSNRLTMRLERSVMEIDGNRDKSFISEFIQKMPAFDSLSVRSHMVKIEPGIDTVIEVTAPSGEIVKTNIPFGPSFFWPKL